MTTNTLIKLLPYEITSKYINREIDNMLNNMLADQYDTQCLFDENKKGLNYKYSIIECPYIKNAKDKKLFIDLYNVIIKLLECNRIMKKTDFKRSQKENNSFSFMEDYS